MPETTRKSVWMIGWRLDRPWQRYALSLALVLLMSFVGTFAQRYLSSINLMMLYLLNVVIVAIYLGRGPAILTSIIGVLAFDFFFIPPQLRLSFTDPGYLLTLLVHLTVGLVVSTLTAQAREQAESARQREAETVALYALSRDLAVAEDPETISKVVIAHIGETFDRTAIVLLPTEESGQALSAHPQCQEFVFDDHEMAAAVQVFKSGAPAGCGTSVLPDTQTCYLPLKTARGMVGVLGAKSEPSAEPLTARGKPLLEAFVSQAALAIERAQLAEAARQMEVLQATERFQAALLNSVSHDLRTPLVTITGALSTLDDDEALLDATTHRTIVQTAREEAERLNRLVENLLNMTRIEAGALHVIRRPGDVEDAISSALDRFGRRLQGRSVSIVLPERLPLVPMHFVLIIQALVNIIDNALKYSPADTPIEIRAREVGAEVQIQVADRGVGIAPEDLERVFDKFYRVHRSDNVTGTGLGLSIAKGIVEAHGGRIWAENNPEGGTTITLALPKERTDLKSAGRSQANIHRRE